MYAIVDPDNVLLLDSVFTTRDRAYDAARGIPGGYVVIELGVDEVDE